jgi:glycerol-3-phosphate dehydrogenase
MVTNGALDARERSAVLRKLSDRQFDVLIVGGGITGAGAALDAASRGLRVALVEARDVASGTSSRSSKLIHGGLRYLEQRDFKLVREALHERDLLVSSLAPHLVRPVSFLYPLYKKVVERPYVGAGLALYDAMEGTHRPVPFHRHLTIKGATRKVPALRTDGLDLLRRPGGRRAVRAHRDPHRGRPWRPGGDAGPGGVVASLWK